MIILPSGWTRQQMEKTEAAVSFANESQAWDWFAEHHPLVAKHLRQFEKPCRQRQDQGEFWWELRACAYYEFLEAPKIIYPDITKGPRFYLDRSGVFLANTAYLLGSEDPYLLGVLNSRLFWFAISNISIPFGTRAGQFRYRLIYQYMEHVPICDVKKSDHERFSLREEIANQAAEMQVLHDRKNSAKTSHEQTALQRQIDAADRRIDRLVYQLYGLSDEEIRIVEEATGS